MKQFSCVILLSVFCLSSHGQNLYTRFIEKSMVSWAQDATDTARFTNPNLSRLLREQLTTGKIKIAVIEPGTSTASDIRFVTKTEVTKSIAPNRIVQTIDAEGNNTGTVMDAEEPLLSSKYFDDETNAKLEVAQIVYIESGRVKSYVPWVSPKYSITTSWGERLGIANAFSTSFKKCRGFSKVSKRKSASLGTRTQVILTDSAAREKMLKQLYGQNLAQALWPHLGKKHYEMQLPGNGRKVTISQINQTLIEESPIAVPVYDEEGNITSKGVVLQESQPMDLSQITRIDIVQDWYYFAKKNRVYSNIKEMLLYAVRSKGGVSSGSASPVLRILVK